MQSIQEFSAISYFSHAAPESVADFLLQTLTKTQIVVLAVSGGSTARAVLPALASRALPWDRVSVTLVDERWVPPNDPSSNERLVRTLLGHLNGIRIIGLHIGGTEPEQAIPLLVERVPEPDVALLGMGNDGHIASLFPGDIANVAQARFAVVRRPDFARLTMTPRALLRVPHILLAFSGAAKRKLLQTALDFGPSDELPVRHILRNAHVFTGP